MMRFITLITTLVFCLTGWAQEPKTIDELIEKYAEIDNIEALQLSGQTINLTAQIPNDIELEELHNLSFENADQEIFDAFLKDQKKLIKEFKPIMQLKERGYLLYFRAKKEGDIMSHIILLDTEERIFISLKGKIYDDSFTQFIKNIINAPKSTSTFQPPIITSIDEEYILEDVINDENSYNRVIDSDSPPPPPPPRKQD